MILLLLQSFDTENYTLNSDVWLHNHCFSNFVRCIAYNSFNQMYYSWSLMHCLWWSSNTHASHKLPYIDNFWHTKRVKTLFSNCRLFYYSFTSIILLISMFLSKACRFLLPHNNIGFLALFWFIVVIFRLLVLFTFFLILLISFILFPCFLIFLRVSSANLPPTNLSKKHIIHWFHTLCVISEKVISYSTSLYLLFTFGAILFWICVQASTEKTGFKERDFLFSVWKTATSAGNVAGPDLQSKKCPFMYRK